MNGINQDEAATKKVTFYGNLNNTIIEIGCSIEIILMGDFCGELVTGVE